MARRARDGGARRRRSWPASRRGDPTGYELHGGSKAENPRGAANLYEVRARDVRPVRVGSIAMPTSPRPSAAAALAQSGRHVGHPGARGRSGGRARGHQPDPASTPTALAMPRDELCGRPPLLGLTSNGRARASVAAMKGLVLAGGTASRLFPLTLVTNKHLLPIYDRPMIYYPLDTLAGMGIREVMVIVGGKSVGDIVELLGDGRHFGLDLTYRYQRGALGIAHAIGLARDFIGDDAFCVVLGDNILRGDGLEATAQAFEAGAWGAGTLLYEVSGPGAVRCRGVRRAGPGRGVRGEAGAAEVEPDPDRRLLPAAGRVRRDRGPGAVRSRRVRDHRRAQPLHPERRPVHRGLHRHLDGRGHGPEPPPRRRARRAGRRRGVAAPRRSPGRASRDERRGSDPAGRAPARHGRRGVHRLGARAPAPGPRRRDAGHRPRPPHLCRQPRQPRRGRGRPGAGRPASRSSAATSRTRTSSGRSSPRPTPSSTSPPRRTSIAASSTRRRSSGPASSASTSCSRRSGARRHGRRPASARPPPASSRSAPTRSTATSPTAVPSKTIRSRREARTPPRRRPRSCSSGRTGSRTASTRS